MKILVVTGGNSSERCISLISAKGVGQALRAKNHQVKTFDFKNGFAELKKIVKNYDAVFPVLHGEEGEGGELQKFLFKMGKPYVGGSYGGCRKGWYKIPFKKFCDKNKILTAPWREVRSEKDIILFGLPCVLKSSSGGSSLEVVIIKKPDDLKGKAYQDLIKSELPLFIERFLAGVEVTVGVLGDQVLPVVEVVPPKGKWFDYLNKYSGGTKELIDAPSLTPKIKKQIQDLTLKIHQILKLGIFSRTDFIISGHTPYVLEVNTIPGLTPTSLFPLAAKAIGLSFDELINKLLNLSLKDKKYLLK